MIQWTPDERMELYKMAQSLISLSYQNTICSSLYIAKDRLSKNKPSPEPFSYQSCPEWIIIARRVTKRQMWINQGYWYPLTLEGQTQRLKDLDEMISLIPKT